MVSFFKKLTDRLFARSGSRSTALYLVPHQDDELLSMGVDICRSMASGDAEVHVILFTDGSKSNMRRRICDGKNCPFHEGIHQYALEIPEFVQARDREFLASCQALGVPAANIHFLPRRAIDGALDQNEAENAIVNMLKAYSGNVTLCTIAPFGGAGQHQDHRILGQAAVNLYQKRVVSNLKLFIEPYCMASSREAFPDLKIHELTADETALASLKQAADAYSLWKPEEGRYAIGYHSVHQSFREYLQNPRGYLLTHSELPQ